ncbi:amidase domain-containing protein [Hathewaya histolytica]|uniref:amidase domain-containing protein n=1 Tax=Hathewaya histolytica TaxID=1498 RepID=UPI003B67F6CD
MRKAIIKKFILCLMCLSLLANNIPLVYANNEHSKSSYTKEDYNDYIHSFFYTKNQTFFSSDLKPIKEFYDTTQNHGKYSLDHEIRRFRYLRDWASERGIRFIEISSKPSIKKITDKGNIANIRVDEEYIFKYVYEGEENPKENQFGVALFHNLRLKKVNKSFKICNDYYLDCFEDGLKAYNIDLKENTLPKPKPQKYDFTKLPKKDIPEYKEVKKGSYNRLKAVEYADRYCGVTWATGNKTPKYNKKYKNFTGIGGNCTNYISQCLGDSDGGGLRHGSGWHSINVPNSGTEGSAAWVNADAFKNHLLYSGKGRLVKKGSFNDLIKISEDNTNPYFEKLELGDIIAYAKKNDIDHNAIITNFDSHGYPMINSHTVDRYHVPFDLGWGDKDIYFHLIHMK